MYSNEILTIIISRHIIFNNQKTALYDFPTVRYFKEN